jgi:hypothetical protein
MYEHCIVVTRSRSIKLNLYYTYDNLWWNVLWIKFKIPDNDDADPAICEGRHCTYKWILFVWRIFSQRWWEVMAHTTSLSHLLLLKSCNKTGIWAIMCMCLMDIDYASVFMLFQLSFGSFPKLWCVGFTLFFLFFFWFLFFWERGVFCFVLLLNV